MTSNLEIAVLSAVNELAARHGPLPTDFVATAGQDTGGYALRFEAPPNRSQACARMDKMLRSLGANNHDHAVMGTEEFVWAALKRALSNALRSRQR